MDLKKIFKTSNPVIGVVHLLPLPTSPRWGGNLQAVIDRAEQEATALASGGVDGIIVENFFDAPFCKDQVDPAVVSAYTRLAELYNVPADETLDDRVDRLLAEYGEIHPGKTSLDCPDSEKERVLSDLEDELPESVAGQRVEKVVTMDGFKVLLEDGSWLLMRPSGTEPKMRVYAEAGSPERADELLEAGADLVRPLL